MSPNLEDLPSACVIRSQRNMERRDREEIVEASSKSSKPPIDYKSSSKLRNVEEKHQLGYLSTGALILNKVMATGIFVAPPTVLAIVGSKGISLLLWLAGGLITWSGLIVYLEYGIRFPLTGGEVHYIHFIWTKPKWLVTYMYAIMFVLLSGSQANALVFGQSILMASTPQDAIPDQRLEKLLGVLLVAVVCQLQATSRVNYIRFANCFALYKIVFLSVVTVMGWCALGGRRYEAAAIGSDPYGTVNLSNAFEGTSSHLYAYALAMLDILRVYAGYENANLVLEEVRRPDADPNRVFRRAAKVTIALTCFFYVMVNVALFAVCSTEELLQAPEVLSLFLTKIFGPHEKIRTISGVLLSISAAGNVMSVTFAAVRVKQEIGRLGILPLPEIWARTTRLDTPGPALFLHWVFSTLLIVVTPLNSTNGYLVFSTLFSYARTVIGILLGIGLLTAHRHKCFDYGLDRWTPQSIRSFSWTFYPLVIFYTLSNLFVFIMAWFPSGFQDALHKLKPTERVVPSLIAPILAVACFGFGVVYWAWDMYILRFLGYELETLQEYPDHEDALVMHMTFERRLSGFAAKVWKKSKKLVDWVRLRREPNNNTDL